MSSGLARLIDYTQRTERRGSTPAFTVGKSTPRSRPQASCGDVAVDAVVGAPRFAEESEEERPSQKSGRRVPTKALRVKPTITSPPAESSAPQESSAPSSTGTCAESVSRQHPRQSTKSSGKTVAIASVDDVSTVTTGGPMRQVPERKSRYSEHLKQLGELHEGMNENEATQAAQMLDATLNDDESLVVWQLTYPHTRDTALARLNDVYTQGLCSRVVWLLVHVEAALSRVTCECDRAHRVADLMNTVREMSNADAAAELAAKVGTL